MTEIKALRVSLFWCFLSGSYFVVYSFSSLIQSYLSWKTVHNFLGWEHCFFGVFSYRVTFLFFAFSTRRWVSLILLGSLRRNRKILCFVRLFLNHFPMITGLCNPFGKGDGDNGVFGKFDKVIGLRKMLLAKHHETRMECSKWGICTPCWDVWEKLSL